MADNSPIEWTDATWNPITGCKVISPGCANCYAMRLAGTRMKHHPSRAGLTAASKAGPVWNGKVKFNEEWLAQPLRWNRPRDIFVVAHGDLFYDKVPDAWIDKVFAVMALRPHHRFQVLTKRPERMSRNYLTARTRGDISRAWALALDPGTMPMTQHEIEARLLPDASPEHRNLYRATAPIWPLPNVWLGVSVEDQTRADERREPMRVLADAGWNTWVSYEPALGPVDWRGWDFIEWMVSGGEDGDRPSHPDWHRHARDWCAIQGIPYHFKQWGAFREWAEPPYDREMAAEIEIGSDEAEAIAAAATRPAWVATDGRHFYSQEAIPEGVRARLMERVGKTRAGRLLDGIEHNGMPRS